MVAVAVVVLLLLAQLTTPALALCCMGVDGPWAAEEVDVEDERGTARAPSGGCASATAAWGDADGGATRSSAAPAAGCCSWLGREVLVGVVAALGEGGRTGRGRGGDGGGKEEPDAGALRDGVVGEPGWREAAALRAWGGCGEAP